MSHYRHRVANITWTSETNDAFLLELAKVYELTITTPVALPINGVRFATVLPSGSKEGWPEIHDHNTRLSRFVNALAHYEYQDGEYSEIFDFVVVDFGGHPSEAKKPWIPVASQNYLEPQPTVTELNCTL